MKYHLLVRPEAEADIEASFNWYEDEMSGLGHEFRYALRSTLSLVRSNLFLFPVVYSQVRRALVKRFPHAFFFFVENEDVIVTACVHHKRNPQAWQGRT